MLGSFSSPETLGRGTSSAPEPPDADDLASSTEELPLAGLENRRSQYMRKPKQILVHTHQGIRI